MHFFFSWPLEFQHDPRKFHVFNPHPPYLDLYIYIQIIYVYTYIYVLSILCIIIYKYMYVYILYYIILYYIIYVACFWRGENHPTRCDEVLINKVFHLAQRKYQKNQGSIKKAREAVTSGLDTVKLCASKYYIDSRRDSTKND